MEIKYTHAKELSTYLQNNVNDVISNILNVLNTSDVTKDVEVLTFKNILTEEIYHCIIHQDNKYKFIDNIINFCIAPENEFYELAGIAQTLK